MKYLFLLLFISLTFSACKKQFQIDFPDEFLSFIAGGKEYYYPQKKNLGAFHTGKLLDAYANKDIPGYILIGKRAGDPTVAGNILFNVSGGALPDRDTMRVSDGTLTVSLIHFNEIEGNYYTSLSGVGMLIFEERTSEWMRGTFYFDGLDINGVELHVTQGTFAIRSRN